MKQIKTVKVDVTNMNTYQETKVLYASELVLGFFQSMTFALKFAATDIQSLRGESESSISKRLNKDELMTLFMTGKEEWNGIADYEIDLHVSRYKKWWSKVKGYIIPMKRTIYVNGKFFDDSSVVDVADNLCHEWPHTLGFRHSGPYIRESIPYLINEWFKLWAATHTPIPKSTRSYKLICKRQWYTLWSTKKCYRVVTNE